MCAHFNKLGSPLKCILKYPTKEDQIARYSSFGYNASAVRMIDFYRQIISQEERTRVRKLELFDEYEQWHLKCTHYVILLGSTGNLSIPQIEALKQVNLVETLVTDSTLIGLSEYPLAFGIRYSHSLCYSNKENKLFVFGGFGESLRDLGKHKRQRSIEIIDLNTQKIDIIDYLDDQIGDRYFCSTHVLSNSSILLLFGRAGPNKPSKSAIFTLNEAKFNIKEFDFSLSEYKPLNRWRHASCTLLNDHIFVYGGITFDEETRDFIVLNDAFIIDAHNGQINQIKFNLNEFKPRHSHSICLWNEYIVISGGLDCNEHVLDDIILVDSTNFSFKSVQLKRDSIQPRYSHSSLIIDDTLILFGGVNFSSKPLGICMIDLNKVSAYEFDLPVQACDLSPLMVLNHQVHLIDKDNILMIGGGGNCFSFGTHINRKPLIFNISNLWKRFNEQNQN
jgi:tRNA wybutosine-synthesizing protein 4